LIAELGRPVIRHKVRRVTVRASAFLQTLSLNTQKVQQKEFPERCRAEDQTPGDGLKFALNGQSETVWSDSQIVDSND